MKRFILVLGILLMLAGVVGFVHPRFTYNSTEEVAKLGNMQANITRQKTAEVPLPLSGLLLASGIGLTIFGTRTKR
jgi:hypothetical protein